MNLAILIGVRHYKEKENDLPACKNDVEVMNSILALSKRFEGILYIGPDADSAAVKKGIVDFVDEHRNQVNDQVFFYFTGHGDFFNGEFYYLLSDFEKSRRKQTALENSELDNLLRSLKAKLVVKIVDACHSGVQYVKEEGVIKKYFDDTKSSFASCYFMFSSNVTQPSYQSEHFSDFTQSFINAIRDFKSDDIRYKDIIDSISDDFEGNTEQTPFFVTQGDFTHRFIHIDSEVRNFLSQLLQPKAEDTATKSSLFSYDS